MMNLLALILALLHASSAIRHERHSHHEELLPGWMGEVSQAPVTSPPSRTWIQTIAWRPRAMIIHNLITAEEAQHIADLSWPKMKRSEVVGPNNESILDDYRTSYGTFLARHETPVVAGVQERVALITRVPVVHQEVSLPSSFQTFIPMHSSPLPH
jgi:prolyl 4-hydroxylase